MKETKGPDHNPERKAAQHLLNTRVPEIDGNDPRYVAITWTSRQALEKDLPTGRITDRSSNTDNPDVIVGIALPGIENTATPHPINARIREFFESPNDALDFARHSANTVAETHFFLEKLHLPLDNPKLTRAAEGYVFSSNPRINNLYLDVAGTDEPQVTDNIEESANILPYVAPEDYDRVPEIAERAREQKGILIAITSNLPDEFHVVKTSAPEDPHMHFSFGKGGMKIENIAASQPLGEEEVKFYESLKENE